MDENNQFINVRPSPRILKILGDIEFDPWQCLAELIDNAFDKFLDVEESGIVPEERPRVRIEIPLASRGATSRVTVTDNGPGMDLTTLNNAVRAGWSSNDTFSRLGLFGMGFNIATARLGSRTTVKTTRDGDHEWIGVVIDLDQVNEDFDVPVLHERKDDPAAHGTVVIVERLNPGREEWLRRNHNRLRQTLGAVYSYLLDKKRYQVTVNEVEVRPRKPCIWGANRSVTYGSGSRAEQIPAVIPINTLLPPAEVCLDCRNWQSIGLGSCEQCGGTHLHQRERRIHGWVGIQRYLDLTDYGIDFLRNGRKILRYDKRVFEWQNINAPLEPAMPEYPTELRQGGRIVGEIHLDHVPVNYMKTAFEWNDRGWIGALHLLRGAGPLLPQRARQYGFGENDSPIGRLHKAFRRNDPGRRYLIPGNGSGPIHAETRRWADRFYDGDPDYQSDAIWWDAVVAHDEIRERRATPSPSDGVTEPVAPGILGRLGLGPSTEEEEVFEPTAPDAPSTSSEAVKVEAIPRPPWRQDETEAQRLARYERESKVDRSLSGRFGLAELGISAELTTRLVTQPVVDHHGNDSPVLMVPGPGGTFRAFVNIDHAIFNRFPVTPRHLVLVELMTNLRVRSGTDFTPSDVMAKLISENLGDERLDGPQLTARAVALLQDVRSGMSAHIRENPERAWQFLSSDERSAIENSMILESAPISFEEARASGEFLQYAPFLFIPRLVESWPEAFMDSRVFSRPFDTVTSPTARRLSVAMIAGYLYDVARVALAQSAMSRDELIRAGHSLDLLESEFVASAT